MNPRRIRAPRDREKRYPLHSTGPARRRWPKAYDGDLPAVAAVQRRYQRVYDGDLRAERRRQTPRRKSLDALRQSPIRNGLIGLAVAGTAAPIAINRHQQALRTNPSHENILAGVISGGEASSDSSLSKMWQRLEAGEATSANRREEVVRESMSRYAEYGLSRELAENIYDVATASEIDPAMAFGLVRAESSFKSSSTSPVGAVGLTQLMPKTADWLEPGVTRSQLRDARTNLRIGFKYLRNLIDKYEGDTDLALLAYNRGPGTVDRELRRGRNPDNGYASFVRGREGHGHSLYTNR